MLATLSLSIPNPDEPGFFVDQRSFSGTGLEGVASSFAMALQPAMPKVLVLTSRSVTLGFKANPMHNILMQSSSRQLLGRETRVMKVLTAIAGAKHHT